MKYKRKNRNQSQKAAAIRAQHFADEKIRSTYFEALNELLPKKLKKEPWIIRMAVRTLLPDVYLTKAWEEKQTPAARQKEITKLENIIKTCKSIEVELVDLLTNPTKKQYRTKFGIDVIPDSVLQTLSDVQI